MLPPDTVVRYDIPGGGGYGPAHERAVEAVVADVRAHYVSVEAARRDYGVEVDTVRWTGRRIG